MKGKRIAAIITALALCLCFVPGCAPQGKSSAPGGEAQTLTVYYVDGYNYEHPYTAFRGGYPDVTVEAVKFADEKTMEEQLVQELSTGTGPDIVLFTGNTTLDLHKMAKSGGFTALDDFLAADESFNPENYLSSAFTGCTVDGQQFFMPFSFEKIIAFRPAHRGATEQNTTTLAEYLAAAGDETTPDVPVVVCPGFTGRRSSFITAYLCGYGLTGMEKGWEGTDPDDFYEMIRQLKMIAKARAADAALFENFEETITQAHTIINGKPLQSFSFANDVWYGQSFYEYYLKEPVEAFVLPTVGSADSYAAMLTWYGAVTKDCKNPALAYEFLRVFLDEACGGGSSSRVIGTPVNRAVFASDTKNLTFARQNYQDGLSVLPLTQEQVDMLLGVYDKIDICTVPNPKISGMIASEFTAFFDDAADYDSCLTSFKRKLMLYQNE